jgi:hypothetical protein
MIYYALSQYISVRILGYLIKRYNFLTSDVAVEKNCFDLLDTGKVRLVKSVHIPVYFSVKMKYANLKYWDSKSTHRHTMDLVP